MHNNFFVPYQKSAFTLIELLVVIVIIGILATISVAQFNSYQAKARNAGVIVAMKEYEKALELYYIEYESYPVVTEAVGKCLGDFESGDTCIWNGQTRSGVTSFRQSLMDILNKQLPKYNNTVYGGTVAGNEFNAPIYWCKTSKCDQYQIEVMLEGVNQDCSFLKGLMTGVARTQLATTQKYTDGNWSGNGNTWCAASVKVGRPTPWY